MKVEFEGNVYNVKNRTRSSACTGCIISKIEHLRCPVDSDYKCILPLDKIYTNGKFTEIFKL